MRRVQSVSIGTVTAGLGFGPPAPGAAQEGAKPAAAAGKKEQPASSADPRDFDGVWWTPGYDRKVRPVEGGLPPSPERGRREWQYNVDADKAGRPVADAPTGCLPHGIPRLLASPYPI